jgi:hypothetical protein
MVQDNCKYNLYSEVSERLLANPTSWSSSESNSKRTMFAVAAGGPLLLSSQNAPDLDSEARGPSSYRTETHAIHSNEPYFFAIHPPTHVYQIKNIHLIVTQLF